MSKTGPNERQILQRQFWQLMKTLSPRKTQLVLQIHRLRRLMNCEVGIERNRIGIYR